jgi:hypothetical protein
MAVRSRWAVVEVRFIGHSLLKNETEGPTEG